MSRCGGAFKGPRERFPRVSGDEPFIIVRDMPSEKFSPRERG